jgi:hypothetical protein
LRYFPIDRFEWLRLTRPTNAGVSNRLKSELLPTFGNPAKIAQTHRVEGAVFIPPAGETKIEQIGHPTKSSQLAKGNDSPDDLNSSEDGNLI